MRYSAVALVMVNAMLAMATPMDKRRLHTEVSTKCVTEFVYPDGSPARGHHQATPAPEKPYVYFHEEAEAEPESQPEPSYGEDRTGSQPSGDSYGAPADLSNPGEDFQSNALYHHNIHRHNHSAPSVTWSDRLASAAQQLANTCNYGHNTDIGGGNYGQNIAMYAATNDLGSETGFIRTSITEYWYNGEIRLYGNAYGREPSMSNFHDWGHFSQIVWKDTTEIGCAVARCGSGALASYPGYFSVCNYGPAGNFRGKYAENVGAPLGEATVNAE